MLTLLSFVLALSTLTVTQDPPQERTLTGCLRTGSAASVYILRGAAADDASASPAGNSRPEDYLLVPGDIALADHVNHRVAITGVVSDAGAPPPPPPSANAAEKALKRLSVKAVKEVAANCAAGR
jgi:hypothetical protein